MRLELDFTSFEIWIAALPQGFWRARFYLCAPPRRGRGVRVAALVGVDALAVQQVDLLPEVLLHEELLQALVRVVDQELLEGVVVEVPPLRRGAQRTEKAARRKDKTLNPKP